MALESTADRLAYMSAFGVPAVVNGVSIVAIFDNEYSELLNVSTSSPTLICVSSDIPNVDYGQTVVVSSASFSGTVRVVMPDGNGITTLQLARS